MGVAWWRSRHDNSIRIAVHLGINTIGPQVDSTHSGKVMRSFDLFLFEEYSCIPNQHRVTWWQQNALRQFGTLIFTFGTLIFTFDDLRRSVPGCSYKWRPNILLHLNELAISCPYRTVIINKLLRIWQANSMFMVGGLCVVIGYSVRILYFKHWFRTDIYTDLH